MANSKRKVKLQTPAGPQLEKVLHAFSFGTNNTSSPTTASQRGDYHTVVRTSQGLYTITLPFTYKSVVVVPVLQKVTAGVLRAEPGVVVNTSTATTVQVRIVDAAGAVQDLAADPNNRINVLLMGNNGNGSAA